MSTLGWIGAIGLLLLFMALSSAYVRRLPVSTSVIYLLVGIAVGPAGFRLLRIDIATEGDWFELLTEIAVMVSLFVGGLRLRVPLHHANWIPAVRLAGPVMIWSIVGTTLLAHYLLGLVPAVALLLAATLAPTDPVLASAVSVNDSEDHDRVRFALSGEAGLNDGAAFPFVMLGLEALRRSEPGVWLVEWAAVSLLWAVPIGLLTGYLIGYGIGRMAIRLRSRQRDTGAPSDFLVLALIALSFVIAEQLKGWGFLAAFAAGVGLRHAELSVVEAFPHPSTWSRRVGGWFGDPGAHPPAETLVHGNVDEKQLEQPAMAAGVLVGEALSFGDTMERLLEVLLVVLVGILLVDVWTPMALLLALALFVVIRPLGTHIMLLRDATSMPQRWLLGWFGIRGIGSLFYLSYIVNHADDSALAGALIGPVITVVACSIVVHGVTVTPILNWYERHLGRGNEAQPGTA